jgi:CPA2 family monovalent cation:H+ antiporter-2
MSTAATVAEATSHLEPLISDLGLILMTAGIAVLLFKKIKQPLVLGYLIAGFLAGNHFHFSHQLQISKVLKFGQRLVLSFYYLV